MVIAADITTAIERLKPHKNEGTLSSLFTDHFIRIVSDIAIYIAFLFTIVVTHGFLATVFVTSNIIAIA